MSRFEVRAIVVVLAIALISGCIADVGDPYHRRDEAQAHDGFILAVSVRARQAMSCSEIAAYAIGGGGYVARGCNLEQSYTCTTRPAIDSDGPRGVRRYSVVCAPDGDPRPTVAIAPAVH